MNKRTFLTTLLAVALAATAGAADLLDTVKQRGTLKIALEGTYPPFNFKNTKGELDGFDVEIGRALAQKLGLKPEFITSEWSGILAGLQAGKYDVIVNQVSATDKRREIFDFTQPYTLSSAQLIVRKDEKRQFKSLADLKGKKLGVGQGSNYADLAKAVEGVEVKTYPSAAEYLQDLALGRVDAALNDSLLVPYLVKQAKLPLKGGAGVGSVEGSAIPYLKGNPRFGAALDKALADIKADGTFRKISIKYFERDVSRPLNAS
ncbi:transporter substrate-binding domain-containing protein [Chitinimonas viridis]|uniref:Transporter substrate-binding domain-containing protein n=1 Tax=Chitinimonas viridis TaxID=664880 RepID=A0ABT8B7P4_9NEIS|nr:transporter substrate-binding domain-containing protein [Chitinimonas viridis]MDN3577621.1 transporter substrate-binding domain-containing protein [Chitinimonas viridis]